MGVWVENIIIQFEHKYLNFIFHFEASKLNSHCVSIPPNTNRIILLSVNSLTRPKSWTSLLYCHLKFWTLFCHLTVDDTTNERMAEFLIEKEFTDYLLNEFKIVGTGNVGKLRHVNWQVSGSFLMVHTFKNHKRCRKMSKTQVDFTAKF